MEEEIQTPHQKMPLIIHESWHEIMQPLFDDPKMAMIKDIVLVQQKCYPAKKDIFKVFEMPINDIRVVILGQDPYPKGEAIGYAFAVDKDINIPASLKVIQKEIITSEVVVHTCIITKSWKELAHWREQGVFLLNCALTVEHGNAGSHTEIWHWFTKQVISYLASKRNLIWMLWGGKAKSYREYITDSVHIKDTVDAYTISAYQAVLIAHHPSAETYPGSSYRFSGCDHFQICNVILKNSNQPIIKW